MTRNMEFYVLLLRDEYSRAKTVRNIICNYGFFDVNDYLDITQMHISSPACTRECVPASASAFAPAAVPNNNPTLTILTSSSKEAVADDGDGVFSAEGNEVRSWLKTDNSAWKQTLIMQSEFPEILEQNWDRIVDFFVIHVTSISKLGNCYNQQAARRYFSTFILSATPARSRMLSAIVPPKDAADADEAKPKVSATPRPEWS